LDTWRNNNNIDKTVTAVRIMLLALRMGWAGLGWAGVMAILSFIPFSLQDLFLK
jgi:hypothetical protein